MDKKIYIDIGSSSVKVYSYFDGKLKLLTTKSLNLKEDFDSKKKELFDLVSQQKDSQTVIKVLGTSVFRKLSSIARKNFLTEFKKETGLNLLIIDQDQENKYLELALIGKAHLNKLVLLINIGGGSTELVVVRNGKAIKRKNIDLGVGNINQQYPIINDQFSKISLPEVVNFIKQYLPKLPAIKIAFYTGGELNYMKLAKYFLQTNNLFLDSDHPSLITLSDFQNRNKEVFAKVSLKKLESLMSDNPKWMHGARACSVFAQAICEKYGVEIIIPSDSNLISGVVREEYK